LDHPHVLLLVSNSSFLLPGGRLRPGDTHLLSTCPVFVLCQFRFVHRGIVLALHCEILVELQVTNAY
jgi:hypothetical protein